MCHELRRTEVSEVTRGWAVALIVLDTYNQTLAAGDDENGAPQQKRKTIIQLEQGKSITRNVLNDWTDPDGDDLLLMGAMAEDPGDIVRTRPDGVLTYQDVGTSDGEKKVTITVSDGRTSTTGEVTVEVEPRGELAPVTNPDHVRTTVGEDVTIFPLRNDADPTGGSMRLASVGEVPNATVQGNYDVGTVTFSSAAAGTYYLEYLATTGPTSSPGLIRVDVTEAEQGSGVPTAVRDVVLLPSRGESLVDVLASNLHEAGPLRTVSPSTSQTKRRTRTRSATASPCDGRSARCRT